MVESIDLRMNQGPIDMDTTTVNIERAVIIATGIGVKAMVESIGITKIVLVSVATLHLQDTAMRRGTEAIWKLRKVMLKSWRSIVAKKQNQKSQLNLLLEIAQLLLQSNKTTQIGHRVKGIQESIGTAVAIAATANEKWDTLIENTDNTNVVGTMIDIALNGEIGHVASRKDARGLMAMRTAASIHMKVGTGIKGLAEMMMVVADFLMIQDVVNHLEKRRGR